MALISLLDAQLAFGHFALLDHTDFSLEPHERVGLIGRNGAGKSSLLKIFAGMHAFDDGALHIQNGIRIAYVAQEPILDAASSVFEAVSVGLAPLIAAIDLYCAGAADNLDELQTQIERLGGWSWEQRVDEAIERLGLPRDSLICTLSGGMKKRVALAQALVTEPDVLLLDEPTNHLDLNAITWLEGLLIDFKGSLIAITHDRSFLDTVATRIVELDRGKLRDYPGNFSAYVTQKAEQLEIEATVNAKADKLLAQEEIWIRKGVEARRTRAQGRITRLQEMRANRAARRDQLGRVNLDVSSGERSGKIVAELVDVCKSFSLPPSPLGSPPAGGTKTIVKDFTSTIMRGDKVGLIAPNGAGKTTLLKIILGELAADSGKVRQGANLTVAYFDQMRDALDLDATLEDFISPGSEWVEIGGNKKHVKSYLADFLFEPARALSPVRSLSGGERNRLLLARLFARPANVLVLDEPTNDLDIDTLELLEDLLQQFDGTVFLVSHDRTFLDNVVTSTIVWEGNSHAGLWREYEGGVSDWLIQSERAKKLIGNSKTSSPQAPSNKVSKSNASASQSTHGLQADAPANSAKKKLSFKDQRELDGLPAKIEALEGEQTTLRSELAEGTVFAKDPDRATALLKRDAEIESALLVALERWENLSS
ncbi:MAG: ATP-binding cassette domain-containing protein [Cytophagales bacterium]|nr:ATP-binding cassette domain-containing protein [Cytophagales bacterium]